MPEIKHEADPEIVEEWMGMGTPIFSHGGIVFTGETYKNVVKMTFAKGAALEDPCCLFNSSLDRNVRRAIDICEGGMVDEGALKNLIRAAVALNREATNKPKPKPGSASSKQPGLASRGFYTSSPAPRAETVVAFSCECCLNFLKLLMGSEICNIADVANGIRDYDRKKYDSDQYGDCDGVAFLNLTRALCPGTRDGDIAMI